MKNTIYLSIIAGLIVALTIAIIALIEKPTTDLPEEYELITPDTPIEGQYKDGVLIIKFKH